VLLVDLYYYSFEAVFASQEFKEGELVLKDQMLVGAQHSSNKVNFNSLLKE
jgi:hypothetical protein